jgi:beta-glucanase (GH16 family)
LLVRVVMPVVAAACSANPELEQSVDTVDPLGSTTDVNPTKDAFVRDGAFAGDNYGKVDALSVKSSSTNYNRHSWITFSTSTLSKISSAKLRLYVNAVGAENGNTIPADLYYTPGADNWGETTITWSNAPATGTKIGSTSITTSSPGTWVEYDVTSQLAANTTGAATFEIVSGARVNRSVTFASREDTAHPPVLRLGTATSGSSSGSGGSSGSSGGSSSSSSGSGSSSGSSSGSGSGSGGVDAGIPGWTLVWSDEFDGPNGSDVDPTKWVHDVGDGSNTQEGVWNPGNGWGNDELEYYTAGNANMQQHDGVLDITATRSGASAYKCWNGACQWTSGRIKTYVGPPTTKNLLARLYGRFEMRAQIPAGQGMWPAFWMMGTKLFTSDWPACGELDIMESVVCPDYPPGCSTFNPATVFGTSHDTASGDEGVSTSANVPNGGNLSSGFHVYAIEWSATELDWFLDGVKYGVQTAPSSPTTSNWPFADPSNPFFLIVNLAVGSGDSNSWGAPPNAQTPDPAHMLVDYVRVYSR